MVTETGDRTGPALFDRRLVFVVGKGGVGKTSVTAALGLAALERGKRVLLVELESENRLLPLLGLSPAADAGPSEIRPGLFRLGVGGRAALEEYLSLVIPVRRVLRAIFDSRIYQYFVAAAPGLKELMTIGKIWYEVDRHRWDFVIVDCPATGHSLQYLRMPKAAAETFPAGLVHREAKRVWELLRDPRQTAVIVVTIAEEMPVNETLELCQQLESELDLPREWLVVNRFHFPGLARDEVAGLERPKDLAPEEAALVDEVLARAEEEASWAELNEMHRRTLAEARPGWKLLVLPFLFREEFGIADLEALGARIADAVDPRVLASARAPRAPR
ncbi:MAG: ArsA family ATPase [Candidatus Binatia bacterium]